MDRTKIMIIDDDQSLLRVMQHHLEEAGYLTVTASDGQEGLIRQREDPCQVVFTDIRMPRLSGLDFITAVREFDQAASIVVITGFPTIENAVEAMKAGALDFIQKPVERDRLLAVAQKATEYFALRSENQRLRTLVADHLNFGNMVGSSPAMRSVIRQAQLAAESNATVLIQGETGTGKELLAKAIHQNSSRATRPFMAINCAAVPASLLESELFGHIRGAFTGALSDRKGMIEDAAGGTFFLDEVGDLPMELQPKLLRVLQEREFQPVGSNTVRPVDVRFMVATHQNLSAMVQERSFREDLFYRLNVVPIALPPVRERREDIIPLFFHFLREAAVDEQKDVPDIAPLVHSQLERYSWPGNVREIQNVARRILALHTGGTVGLDRLPEQIVSIPEKKPNLMSELPPEGIDLEEWVDRLIIQALQKNDWNQSKTAAYLNISRNTLVYRMDKRPLLKTARQERENP